MAFTRVSWGPAILSRSILPSKIFIMCRTLYCTVQYRIVLALLYVVRLLFVHSGTSVRILGPNLEIHSHLYKRQLCLEISIFSNSHSLLQLLLQFSYCTLYMRKEENLIKIHTPPPPFVLRNPYRNLIKNSQDYVHKPQRNRSFIDSDSGPNKF